MADRSKIFDAGFFEVRQIVAVVDDAHGIGLGEPDPDGMRKGKGAGIDRWLERGNRIVHVLDRSCQVVSVPSRWGRRQLSELTCQEMFRTFATVALIASFVA